MCSDLHVDLLIYRDVKVSRSFSGLGLGLKGSGLGLGLALEGSGLGLGLGLKGSGLGLGLGLALEGSGLVNIPADLATTMRSVWVCSIFVI